MELEQLERAVQPDGAAADVAASCKKATSPRIETVLESLLVLKTLSSRAARPGASVADRVDARLGEGQRVVEAQAPHDGEQPLLFEGHLNGNSRRARPRLDVDVLRLRLALCRLQRQR